MTDGEPLHARLRAGLVEAMRARDRVATSAYRTALTALDNAEAVNAASASLVAEPDAHVAGAVGLGAAEVPRRLLDGAAQRAVVQSEIADLRRAADDFAGAGRPTDALRLWAQADLLQALLT